MCALCMMSVVLSSVRVATSKSCTYTRGDYCHSSGMLSSSVSNMTRLLVSVRAHGFCSVRYSYGYFLQVDALRTVSTRQNKECRIDNGTPAVLSAHAHLTIRSKWLWRSSSQRLLAP